MTQWELYNKEEFQGARRQSVFWVVPKYSTDFFFFLISALVIPQLSLYPVSFKSLGVKGLQHMHAVLILFV